MSAAISLQPKLDLRAAGALRADILGHAGEDLMLDASGVTHLGALAVQVIRAAARSWAEAGKTLTLGNASTDLADQLDLFGFTPDTITAWRASS